MFKSRAVQYLGLALLVALAIGVIYFPLGAAPREQQYSLTLSAPKAFTALAGKQKPGDLADDALAAAFKSPEKIPAELELLPASTSGGSTATYQARIRDTASTRAEAQARSERIAKALAKPFPGIKLASVDSQALSALPEKPVLTLGNLAVYPPHKRDGQVVPAVKLGLDLQGGVNLVLQVRRALFTYKMDETFVKGLKDADARDNFTRQVREAFAKAPSNLELNQAEVNFSVGSSNNIEVRTQAKDKAQFDAQRAAIKGILSSSFASAKLSEAREPQFFDPAAAENGGITNSTAILDRTVEIVRSRVDSLGVAEPQIQKQAPDRIIVQLPGLSDPQRAQDVVGKTAQLSIALLPQEIEAFERGDETLFRDKATGNPIPSEEAKRRSQTIVSGTDIKPTARAGNDEAGRPAVFFELQGPGSTRFGQITAQNVGRIMPIFLDESCISAPNINSAITGGSGQISGGFKTLQEAQNLSLLLNSGALPAPIDVVENRTVSATLGQDSLAKSLHAGMIGILAVAIFMLVYYRLPGLLANCALVIYFVLNLAAFVLIGGTLTLPGIAGFLLAVAMSLDTNVLVFERLREEMATQPNFAAALRAAFSRAWTAILDSHVTTLIASSVLFYLGTGPVKGFALTLGIGVLLSLFSAISVTRLFMWSLAGVGERNPKLFGKPAPRSTVTTATAR